MNAGRPTEPGAQLFKKFAGIDVFDIELAERDLDKLIDIIAALEPAFGGVAWFDRRLGDRRVPAYGSFWKPNTGGFIPHPVASLPTLPVALTTNFELLVAAITSGEVRFKPLVLLALARRWKTP